MFVFIVLYLFNVKKLVMEYCSSGSLMHVMDILQRPLYEIEIKVVCKHIVQAFSIFHSFVIHRDVKAANVIDI
jgi:serine/threonine protein kinase